MSAVIGASACECLRWVAPSDMSPFTSSEMELQPNFKGQVSVILQFSGETVFGDFLDVK